MDAPEKIYIPTILAANAVRYKEEGSIEYTRTDAFIEKAVSWLKENADHYVGHYLNDDDTYMDESFIEDFKNFMKGE